MEGVDLTPNYANLRRIFTREVDQIVKATIQDAATFNAAKLDDLSTLMSRLTILVLSIDSPQAMDEFTDALSKWNVDLRTRVDELTCEEDDEVPVPEGVQPGGLL